MPQAPNMHRQIHRVILPFGEKNYFAWFWMNLSGT